jgi:uncharacterized protein with GYD domain
MPTYLMLSTIGPEGAATLREHPRRIKEVNDEVAAMGVTVLAQYALLGEWDFLNILDAPDDATVARMSIELASRGTLKTQTITAIPIDEFIARLEA